MAGEEYRKLRIYFTKEGDSRFLSHLDLMRTMERAVRRAGLPVRMTEGMNPHVKMSFPTALPLGLPSRLEVVELSVAPEVTVAEVCGRLAAELPAGLRPFDGDVHFTGERWRVEEIAYEIRGDGLPGEEAVAGFLARETVPAVRRGKEVDLRPLVTRLRRDGPRLLVGIAWRDTGTARPEDVLRALGVEPAGLEVAKVGMTFLTSAGERIEKTNDAPGPDQRP